MAKNMKVVLNKDGVRALLRSEEVMNMCAKHAKEIASKAGDAYKVNRYRGESRANVSVYTDDPDVIRDNLENNTLLKQAGLKQPGTDTRNGRQVKGYYRKLKNGKTIWVEGYQRRK